MPGIPDKQFFKIGEASRITGVKPHVLRYWESEFSSLRPQKSRTNQRLYKRSDVELLLFIKKLLYGEGYTIAGAKKHMKELRRSRTKMVTDGVEVMQYVRDQVAELLELIEQDD